MTLAWSSQTWVLVWNRNQNRIDVLWKIHTYSRTTNVTFRLLKSKRGATWSTDSLISTNIHHISNNSKRMDSNWQSLWVICVVVYVFCRKLFRTSKRFSTLTQVLELLARIYTNFFMVCKIKSCFHFQLTRLRHIVCIQLRIQVNSYRVFFRFG